MCDTEKENSRFICPKIFYILIENKKYALSLECFCLYLFKKYYLVDTFNVLCFAKRIVPNY